MGVTYSGTETSFFYSSSIKAGLSCLLDTTTSNSTSTFFSLFPFDMIDFSLFTFSFHSRSSSELEEEDDIFFGWSLPL